MNRKSCENCREGVRCRACGAQLRPLPGLLSARDYMLMLALIDGSDRKYAPKTLETVAAVLEAKNPKAALQRLRAKLRQLLEAAEDKPAAALPDEPATAREAVMRRAKAGEISWDEALKQLEAL